MNCKCLSVVMVGIAMVAVSPTAVATAGVDGWTSSFVIPYLDTTTYPGPAGDGYGVQSPGGFVGTTSNPAGCTGSLTYAYPSTTIPVGAARELVARTILSAYLAGKQVRLFMSGTKCLASNGTLTGTGTNGVPVYLAVSIQ